MITSVLIGIDSQLLITENQVLVDDQLPADQILMENREVTIDGSTAGNRNAFSSINNVMIVS